MLDYTYLGYKIMPYTHQWYDQDRGILQWNMFGEVNWDQFNAAVEALCNIIEETSQRVDILILDDAGMPSGNPLPHLKHSMSRLNNLDNFGGLYSVTEKHLSALVKTMTSLAAKLANLNFPLKFMNSVEDALVAIERDREKVR